MLLCVLRECLAAISKLRERQGMGCVALAEKDASMHRQTAKFAIS
jgi:hypothetical protein